MRRFLIVAWLAILCPLAPLSAPAWAQSVAGSFDDAHRADKKALVEQDAQDSPSRAGKLLDLRSQTEAVVHQDSIRSALARSQSQSPRKDPLWNGVVAGAAVGAVIGAFGGHLLLDCDGCSAGFNVPLTFGVLGAGVGAGIGAGIDAWRDSQTTAGGRFPGLAPIFGKARRGLAMWIRF